MPFAQSLFAVMPEVVILTAAALILIVDLFVDDERRHVTYWLAQLALLIAACVTLKTTQLDIVKAFHNMVVDDMLADLLRMTSFVAVSLMLFYSRSYLLARGLFRGETFVLTLFVLLGIQVIISGNSFLTLYLGVELMSLSLYALVALERERAGPAEASMKYFVLGALASGVLLYGMSMIYGATGSLDIDLVARSVLAGGGNSLLLTFGLVFVVSGVAFKLGVVPYHMWIPDFMGLSQCSPWWAFIMLLVMFSLAGIPPMVGFYAKFTVIEAAINAGFVWLAVLAVVTSLIGAFHYLRIVRLMYFVDPVVRSPLETRADARTLLS